MSSSCTRCCLTLWEGLLPTPLCTLPPPSPQRGAQHVSLLSRRVCNVVIHIEQFTIGSHGKKNWTWVMAWLPSAWSILKTSVGSWAKSWMSSGNQKANVGRASVRNAFQMGKHISLLCEFPEPTCNHVHDHRWCLQLRRSHSGAGAGHGSTDPKWQGFKYRGRVVEGSRKADLCSKS